MSKLADFTKNRKNSTDKKETKKPKERVKLNNNKDNTAEIEKKSDFREKLVSQKRIKDNYDTKNSIQFVSTGCTTLNLSLTNDARKGYPVGRVVNVVSDYSCGKCIKNAYVLTKGGMVKIDDLVADEGIFKYKTKVASFRNEIKDTSYIYKEKVDKTIKINTKFGFEIEGTKEHPVMIFNPEGHEFKMVELENIKEGDWVVIQKGMNYFTDSSYKFSENEKDFRNKKNRGCVSTPWDNPVRMTSELARLLGYFVADGNFMPSSICISNSRDYIIEDINNICKNLNLGFGVNKYISGIEFRTFVHNLFDNPEEFKAKHKFVPRCILQSTKEHQAEFLRALMDCDSSYDEVTSFEYSTASKELGIQVQLMLLNFGIFSSRTHKKVKTYPDNDYYRVRISSMDYDTYSKEIGSLKYNFDYTPKKNMGVIPNFLPKIWNHIHEIKEEEGASKNGRIPGKGIFPRYVPTSGKKKLDASYKDIQKFIDLYSKYTDVSEYQELLNYHFAKIIKKEIIKKETFVYDFTVPDGHLFWSNGMISHNTLLACELVNSVWYNEHVINGKNVKIYYDEPEAAFDLNLASEFGMPLDNIIGIRQRVNDKYKGEFKHSKTIEDFVERIDDIIKSKDKNDIVLYVLDSLDSISDEREQAHIEKKGIGSQDYGGGKASVLSKFFRTKIQDLHDNNILLFIISQIRDNINAGLFGKKYKRSGGKALDFYCSQIIWLYEAGKIESNRGIVQGIEVRVGVEKNKVGERYHKVTFNILHGFGIDNISSMIDFLWEKGGFEKSGAYVVWKGKDGSEKKLHRSELGKIADNDKWVYNKLVSMCQETWDEMLEEAKKSIVRNKKWGGDKDFIQ